MDANLSINEEERFNQIKERLKEIRECENGNTPKCYLDSGPYCGEHKEAHLQIVDDLEFVLSLIY